MFMTVGRSAKCLRKKGYRIERIAVAVLPMIALLLAVLGIITYCPSVPLLLVR